MKATSIAVAALAITVVLAGGMWAAVSTGTISVIGVGHTPAIRADGLKAIAGGLPRDMMVGRAALAAEATDVGHWRFMNPVGEPFTAAGQIELNAAFRALAPASEGRPERLHLYVTSDTVFKHAAAIAELPQSIALSLMGYGEALGIQRQRDGARDRLLVMMRPGLYLEAADRATFEEIAWQLQRPVIRAAIRTLALEPGGPTSFNRSPDVDHGTRRAKPDAIDPGQIGRALGRLAGQFVLVMGRVEGERLRFKPATGPDGLIEIASLQRDAAAADVNLIVLGTSSARQPGSRNLLWQRVDVGNAAKVHAASSLGEMLHSLAGDAGRLVVTGTVHGGDRATLHVRSGDRSTAARTIGDVVSGTWSDIVSETAGSLTVVDARSSLVGATRQRELDRRLVPHVPSVLQIGYLALLVAGLLALPVLRQWWRRLWPDESAGDYASRTALKLAHAARWLLFGAIFLPVAGLPGLVARLIGVAAVPSRTQSGQTQGNAATG